MNAIPEVVLAGIKTGERVSSNYSFSDEELAFLIRQKLVLSLIPPNTRSHNALALRDSQKQRHEAILGALEKLSVQTNNAMGYAVIKGLSFERSIYGTELRRDTNDIDILVHPADIALMHETLLSMGYQQQTGPSSLSSIDTPARALAVIRASQNARDLPANEPVRRHPFKGELSPYVKLHSPTIEIHDSFLNLPRQYLEHLIASAGSSKLHLLTDPLDTLVLLIVTTYDNSESLFSNCFDYSICLRDYYDLSSLLRNHKGNLSPQTIKGKITSLGLERKTQKIVNNLDCIDHAYDDDALACNPSANRSDTDKRHSIINRVISSSAARQYGLEALRSELLRISQHRQTGVISSKIDPDFQNRTFAVFEKAENDVIAKLYFPDSALGNNELIQLAIYPLANDSDSVAFKIDVTKDNDKCKVCARASKRLLSGATLQKEGSELYPTSITHPCESNSWNIAVTLPFVTPFCAELNRYAHHHSNVYWLSDQPKWMIDGDLAFGNLNLIRDDCLTLEIEINECICRIVTNDPESLVQISKLFPSASEGCLRLSNGKALHVYDLAKSTKGYSLSLLDQPLIEFKPARDIYATLMEEIEKRVIEEAHDNILAAHAATVLTEGSCILLMGKSGSGKSSLAQTLLASTIVLGDECALIDTVSGNARCENYPLNIKSQNIDILKDLQCEEALEVSNTAHGSTFFFPLKWTLCKELPIKSIIIPSYSTNGPRARLRKISYAECAQTILSSLIGKQSQSEIFATFSTMLSAQNIELHALDFADVKTAALTLLEKFPGEREL